MIMNGHTMKTARVFMDNQEDMMRYTLRLPEHTVNVHSVDGPDQFHMKILE